MSKSNLLTAKEELLYTMLPGVFQEADKEKEELAVIEQFLPEQMDEVAIKNYLEKLIAEVGAASAADIGKVMGRASKELAGKADGKTISLLAKSLLSGS